MTTTNLRRSALVLKEYMSCSTISHQGDQNHESVFKMTNESDNNCREASGHGKGVEHASMNRYDIIYVIVHEDFSVTVITFPKHLQPTYFKVNGL